MNNVLLLGNGFDLYYKLPTKYINFLNVVNYLLNNRTVDFDTIGKVFSDESLLKKDTFIAECYAAHSHIFDNTLLDKDDISKIINLTENNYWYTYLNKVFDKDVGWIDFEKEIAFVLECFEKVFEKSTVLTFTPKEKSTKYVIECFDFYMRKASSNHVAIIGSYHVNTEYCIESPCGSGHNAINKEKVIEKLYSELSSLSKALKLYLKCFVEKTYELLKTDEKCKRIGIFSYVQKAITFNYTNAYENLYFTNSTFHIHGNISDEIVLGMNPNESDRLENIDTTFLCFKKYFQRTLLESDQEYLRWIKEMDDNKNPYRLFVMGHSLDVTDGDIIEELFQKSSDIVILYHNFEAKKNHISNIINIFGKEGFDMLRRNKMLRFISLDSDLTSLKEDLEKESQEDLLAAIMEK